MGLVSAVHVCVDGAIYWNVDEVPGATNLREVLLPPLAAICYQ